MKYIKLDNLSKNDYSYCIKPNSIMLASSELAPKMFGASSQLVRSWFEAEIWPIVQLASSELARASRFAAKFHFAS